MEALNLTFAKVQLFKIYWFLMLYMLISDSLLPLLPVSSPASLSTRSTLPFPFRKEQSSPSYDKTRHNHTNAAQGNPVGSQGSLEQAKQSETAPTPTVGSPTSYTTLMYIQRI